MKKAIFFAAALTLAGALAGCATTGETPAYTPPPGYILVPAPGADSGYYGTPYDWYPGEVPAFYQGNPFYLPYYWYGYAPFYFPRPRPCGKNCAHGGGNDKPPVNVPPPSNGKPLPLPIEPRNDMRINPNFRGGIGPGRRPIMPRVPEPKIPRAVPRDPAPVMPQSVPPRHTPAPVQTAPPPQQVQVPPPPPPNSPRHRVQPPR